tara:strand:+ start:2417 stop:3679 length:1263 start_codon:yes stop_codon:yes gene_type:complete
MIGFGQNFEFTFNGVVDDAGKCVQQTNDGGYIVAGCTESTSHDENVFLIKTNVFGIEEWRKDFGGLNWDEGESVRQTIDGGYVIAGTSYSPIFGDGDMYLIKVDGNGNEQWSKNFAPDSSYYSEGNSVQQTNDTGYIICGTSVVSDYNVYLVKTDLNGNEQWSQMFGGINFDEGKCVQQTNDDGYIVSGHTWDLGNSFSDILLLKIDMNGNEQWNKSIGGLNYDVAEFVQQTNDGGYIITGYTRDFSDTIGLTSDIYLLKTDENGNELWSKTFGGFNGDEGKCIQQTNDGGFIITGSTRSFSNGDNDVYLIKTDGNGNEQWSKKFGGIGDDEGEYVQQTSDGGYIVTGSSESFGSNEKEVYLIKTDGTGNVTSSFNILNKRNIKLQKTVDLLSRDSKPQKNVPFLEIYDDGTVEKKIIID